MLSADTLIETQVYSDSQRVEAVLASILRLIILYVLQHFFGLIGSKNECTGIIISILIIWYSNI